MDEPKNAQHLSPGVILLLPWWLLMWLLMWHRGHAGLPCHDHVFVHDDPTLLLSDYMKISKLRVCWS
jgi:hypothetical protein